MLKNDFFGSPKVKWLHLTGEVNKSVRCYCRIFSDFMYQKVLKSVNFWQSYSKKIKKVGVLLGHSQGQFLKINFPVKRSAVFCEREFHTLPTRSLEFYILNLHIYVFRVFTLYAAVVYNLHDSSSSFWRQAYLFEINPACTSMTMQWKIDCVYSHRSRNCAITCRRVGSRSAEGMLSVRVATCPP